MTRPGIRPTASRARRELHQLMQSAPRKVTYWQRFLGCIRSWGARMMNVGR